MNIPIGINGEESIGNGISKILKEKISRILILENNQTLGIVSEKDICKFLLTNPNEPINSIPIKNISKKIITIMPQDSIISCAEKMISNDIGSLGVQSDEIVGIVTKTDVVRVAQEIMKDEKSSVEMMSDDYLWEFSNEPIKKIFQKMIDFNISRLILKEQNEITSGIITMRDLLKLGFKDYNKNSIDKEELDTELLFERFNSKEILGNKISTKEIISVSMTEDISKICQMLLSKGIDGLGVLNDNNIIWGILTKTDILKAMINKKELFEK